MLRRGSCIDFPDPYKRSSTHLNSVAAAAAVLLASASPFNAYARALNLTTNLGGHSASHHRTEPVWVVDINGQDDEYTLRPPIIEHG